MDASRPVSAEHEFSHPVSAEDELPTAPVVFGMEGPAAPGAVDNSAVVG